MTRVRQFIWHDGSAASLSRRDEVFMSCQQIAVMEAKREQFDRVSQVKRFSAVAILLTTVEFLFGCWHRNLSRPFTLSGWTYEVCLNCGKQFPYNRAEITCGVSKQKDSCSPLGVPARKPPKSSTAIQLARRSGIGSLVPSIKSTARDLVSL